MPKYQVRVEALASIRVYDFIFVEAASPEHAEQEANWDEMHSATDTFNNVTATAVTLDQEPLSRTNALPQAACHDD